MAETTTWKIDPSHSTIEFAVKHMMFTTVRGRFKEVTATIVADERNPTRSTVNVEINAASIDTGTPDRDKHLVSPDFLDVAKFPKITFKSKRVEGAIAKDGDKFRVVGDLTIRGTTKEVTLECVYEGRGKDPWGGERAGFAASTHIDRREWGLQWNQTLETGGILVGNDVRIEAEVQSVKQVPVSA
jgi:polyisoprenoid-binding protein YceI